MTNKQRQKIQQLLDTQYSLRNTDDELKQTSPDPLLVARIYKEDSHFAEIALICALLSYGNAKMIVKLLQSLDFGLLTRGIDRIQKANFPHYRFQTSEDIQGLFMLVKILLESGGLLQCFMQGYESCPHTKSKSQWSKSNNPNHAKILSGIYYCIDTLHTLANRHKIPITQGLRFLLGSSHSTYLAQYHTIPHNASCLKRWNMLLRWLIRKDRLDVGTWDSHLQSSNLILPLDTHTFRICGKLGILKRKSYDLSAALEATDTLALFNPKDPIAYDFALYRLGQNGIL